MNRVYRSSRAADSRGLVVFGGVVAGSPCPHRRFADLERTELVERFSRMACLTL